MYYTQQTTAFLCDVTVLLVALPPRNSSASTATIWVTWHPGRSPCCRHFSHSRWNLAPSSLARSHPVTAAASPWLFLSERKGQVLGPCVIDPALASLIPLALCPSLLPPPPGSFPPLLSSFLSLCCSRPTFHRPLLLCLKCLPPTRHMLAP